MTREEIIKLARERKVRIVVCPGHVRSNTDGQLHYIGPATLLHLYGIPADVPYRVYPSREDEFHGWRDLPNDIQLHPMRNGNYSLEARGQA
jgi:hypothetical protein